MEELQNQINELKKRLDDLNDYSTIPLKLENALVARGFSRVSTTVGLAGTSTVYVAASSGGVVTTAITFTNGIRTS